MMIGKLLRLWRNAHGLGSRDAAKKLGLSHATLNRIERGERCDMVTMLKLVNWLFSANR
jgi:transcriptional regulator with XRE-family HTH domain